MRQSRHQNRWAAAAATLTCLVLLAFATTIPVRADETPTPTPTAIPDPIATLAPTPTPSPTADPALTPAPTASPVATPTPTPCEPIAMPDVPDVYRGGPVDIWIEGFPADATVTLWFGPVFEVGDRPPLGSTSTDGDGVGMISGIIPVDASSGAAEMTAYASEDCWAETWVIISRSPREISIDDRSVAPGQLVTVTAGGFGENVVANLTIDSFPTQGECIPACRVLAISRTSDVGSVLIQARIPRNTPAGRHQLWVNGVSADLFSDMNVGIDITVIGPIGTLPPTDTE